jgi:hypothetical protein
MKAKELISVLKRELRWVSDPTCPKKKLLKLASSKNTKVLRILVRRLDVTEEILLHVASNNGRCTDLLAACVRHPNAGPATMSLVSEEFLAAIFTRPLCLNGAGEILITLTDDASASAERLAGLAQFASYPIGIQYLSYPDQATVTRVIAQNENSPPELLLALSKLYEWLDHKIWPTPRQADAFEVLRACIANPSLPTERLVELSGHKMEEIRDLVAERMVKVVEVR